MSLKSLKLPTKMVPVPGGDDDQAFAVRGLTLSDIKQFLLDNAIETQMVFDSAKSMADGNDVDWTGFAASLINVAPRLVAQAIAVASDDPDSVKIAEKLPIEVQIDALDKIASLTFSTEGGPKKVLEIVMRLMGQAQEPQKVK